MNQDADMPPVDVRISEQCAELFAALSAFQGDVTAPKKTASNPHFKSKFADLAEVIEAVRAPLAKHGLALTQMPVGACTDHVRVVTLVTHKSGQWLKGVLDMPLPQKTPQGVGSAVSYARRYCAMAALGIAAEDDDGEAAEGRGKSGGNGGTGQHQQRQSSEGAEKVVATLSRELQSVTDFDGLASFYNHARAQLSATGASEQQREALFKEWGARCKVLKIEPKDVASAATANGNWRAS